MSGYSFFSLAVGYEVSVRRLLALWGEQVSPAVKEEPRWDPKTGKPVEPERVELEGFDAVRFQGKLHAVGDDDLLAALGTAYAAVVTPCSKPDTGWDESSILFFEPAEGLRDAALNREFHYGDVYAEGAYDLSKLFKARKAVRMLGATLREEKLRPGRAKVRILGSYDE